MSGTEKLPEELKAVEAALSALVPRTDRLDRQRLMFLAGRESVIQPASGGRFSRRRWVWPLTTLVTTTAAAVLLVMLLVRPEPEVIHQIVYGSADGSRSTGEVAQAAARDGDSPDTVSPVAVSPDAVLQAAVSPDTDLQPAAESLTAPGPGGHPAPSLARAEAQPQPMETEERPWWRLLAGVIQVDWPESPPRSRYAEEFQRMLAAGPDIRWDYVTEPLSAEGPSGSPASYQQLLDNLLRDSLLEDAKTRDTPPIESLPINSFPLTPGAN